MASVLSEPVYRIKENSKLNRLYAEKEKQGKVVSEAIKQLYVGLRGEPEKNSEELEPMDYKEYLSLYVNN